MKETIKTNIEITKRVQVDETRMTSHLGEGLGVYATPFLVKDIEGLCHELIAEHLDVGESSVGTKVNIKHMSATPQGLWVDITAKITEVDRRAIHFEVQAHDQFDQVASCQHSRFVVDLEGVKQRVADKIARAEQA